MNIRIKKNPSPEGRGSREAAGEGCKDSFLHPSPGASHHPLRSGEGLAAHLLAALALAGVLLLVSHAVTIAQAPTASKPAQPDAKAYRAFLNQYCVSCHNTKAPQPTAHPVDLEKANLD